jgi:hypothetical protein
MPFTNNPIETATDDIVTTTPPSTSTLSHTIRRLDALVERLERLEGSIKEQNYAVDRIKTTLTSKVKELEKQVEKIGRDAGFATGLRDECQWFYAKVAVRHLPVYESASTMSRVLYYLEKNQVVLCTFPQTKDDRKRVWLITRKIDPVTFQFTSGNVVAFDPHADPQRLLIDGTLLPSGFSALPEEVEVVVENVESDASDSDYEDVPEEVKEPLQFQFLFPQVPVVSNHVTVEVDSSE